MFCEKEAVRRQIPLPRIPRASKLPESSLCPEEGPLPPGHPGPAGGSRARSLVTAPAYHCHGSGVWRSRGPHTWESCPPSRAYPSQLTPQPPGSGHMWHRSRLKGRPLRRRASRCRVTHRCLPHQEPLLPDPAAGAPPPCRGFPGRPVAPVAHGLLLLLQREDPPSTSLLGALLTHRLLEAFLAAPAPPHLATPPSPPSPCQAFFPSQELILYVSGSPSGCLLQLPHPRLGPAEPQEGHQPRKPSWRWRSQHGPGSLKRTLTL